MPQKKHKPEDIVAKLRHVNVLVFRVLHVKPTPRPLLACQTLRQPADRCTPPMLTVATHCTPGMRLVMPRDLIRRDVDLDRA
jgi:hypothetical protein